MFSHTFMYHIVRCEGGWVPDCLTPITGQINGSLLWLKIEKKEVLILLIALFSEHREKQVVITI